MSIFTKPNMILRIEAFFMLVLLIFCYWKLEYSWWIFAILFFVPDFSIAAYAISPRIGSYIYNLFHSTIFPIALVILSFIFEQFIILSLGLIWAAHIAFDRALGYGLKYPTAFQDTHLGTIEKNKN